MAARDEHIRGWELANPDPALFSVAVVDVAGECRKCRNRAECFTPAESIRELVPKRGKIVPLDSQRNPAGDRLTYYALLGGGTDPKFIVLKQSRHCWATASCLDFEELPAHVLAEWHEKGNRSAAVASQ